LASVSFPAGFTAAVASTRAIDMRRASPGVLALILLPFVLIGAAVWQIDPARLTFRMPSAGMVAAALLLAPVCIAVEAGVQTLVRAGSLRGVVFPWVVHHFWNDQRSVPTYGFLVAIAAAEEFAYRQLAYEILATSFGTAAAMLATSILYGLNHLYFGSPTALSKSLVGLIYAGLYVAGGSLLLPVLTHALQSVLLLRLSAPRHG
jgi:membrane protease YdiL (CAAX protease family)